MTKSQRRQQLIEAFFKACLGPEGAKAGAEFIRERIFQETVNEPNMGIRNDENVMQAVARKYSALDEFAIIVGNYIKGVPGDATPANITTRDRVVEFTALKPEIGKAMFGAFMMAGHQNILPMLELPEYKTLKKMEDDGLLDRQFRPLSTPASPLAQQARFQA